MNNYQDKFMAHIDEKGNIYSTDMISKVQSCIGVTVAVYNSMKNVSEIATEQAIKFSEEKNLLATENEELKTKTDHYYNLLIDNGIITKPKTQDEIIQELMDNNLALQKNNIELNKKIDSILFSLEKNKEIAPGGNEDVGPKPNISNGEEIRTGQKQNKPSVQQK